MSHQPLTDIHKHRLVPINNGALLLAQHTTPRYNGPHTQGHFPRSSGGPFGYRPQTSFGQDYFDPRWASHSPFGGPTVWYGPSGIPHSGTTLWKVPWQQQGPNPGFFVQNGTTYFSQPSLFAQSAPEPQWEVGIPATGLPTS